MTKRITKEELIEELERECVKCHKLENKLKNYKMYMFKVYAMGIIAFGIILVLIIQRAFS